MKKYKVSKEFILEAHESACSEWKQKLEKEFPEVFENKIEVGKWYKIDEVSNYLINYSGKEDNYGFYHGVYSTDLRFNKYHEDNSSIATDREVEEALIAEAKKRYNVGDKLSEIWDDSSGGDRIFSHDLSLENWRNYLWIDNDCGYSSCIFKDGKWAEIIDEKAELKEEIKSLEDKLKELRSKL